MAAIPTSENCTLSLLDRAVEADSGSSPGRYHLGASIIGRECRRELWYSFRWTTVTKHSGRLLRLFARGQREEDWFNHLLRLAGVTVWDVDPDMNQQWRVEAVGGHFGGSLDGVLMGVAEAPKTPHVSEQKTHNDKSFKGVVKSGVAVAKPEHYSQMQIYMHLMNIPRALYQAVNKNDDALYFERVEHEPAHADALLRKAEHIITSDRPPEGISTDAAFYKCKFCDHQALCHGYQTPAVSCRTCAYATPQTDGDARWSCEKHKKNLTGEEQREACPAHLFIPELLGNWAKAFDSADDRVDFKNTVTGHSFANGGEGGYSSKEISRAIDIKVIGDPEVDHLRKSFSGEVTG